MKIKRLMGLAGIMVIAGIGMAACDEEGEPTPVPTQVFDPTPAPEATPEPTATPSSDEPTPTPTESNGGEPTGDPDAGQQIFNSQGCSGCHSTGTDSVVGPGLADVWDRAGDRVEGLSAAEYIRESIREPDAFVVEDFPNAMQAFPESDISESEMQDLIAYLRTL